MVTRTRFNVTFICTLPVLLKLHVKNDDAWIWLLFRLWSISRCVIFYNVAGSCRWRIEVIYDYSKYFGEPVWLSRYSDQDTNWTVRGSNPNTFKRFLSPPNRPDRLWSPPSLLFSGFRGLKRPECEVNHSRQSSAKVKEWSPNYFPPICLYRLERGNFTFVFVSKWELHDSGGIFCVLGL
jgi:hypothetical protein